MDDVRVTTDPPRAPASPYEEWGRLTRFLESARLAFAREQDLWGSLVIRGQQNVRISGAAPAERYEVPLKAHIDAVADAETLHASVLVHSYALAENAAADHLALDARNFGGIEDWGARLLRTTHSDWTAVKGGLAGAVEVAVVRNAFAHGSRLLDAAAERRLMKAGAPTKRAGTVVTLTYDELRTFRARLLSLLNTGGVRP